MVFGVQTDVREGDPAHLADGGRSSGGDHEVVGLRLLQHEPHRFNIVAGKSPIPLRINISEAELRFLTEVDAGNRIGYLASYEFNASKRRLMVEEDSAGCMQVEALAIIYRAPVREEL